MSLRKSRQRSCAGMSVRSKAAHKRATLDTEGDRGLAEYIRNRILRQKVFRMFPDVEVWQGELWGYWR